MNRPTPLAAALALLLPASLLAGAADAADSAAPQAEAGKPERIEVTGSRIKRTDIEGASPVTVLTGQQMLDEGFATVADALASLTEAFGSAQNDLNSSGGFTPNAAVVNLRALGTGRALVLINGRRVADYPLPYNGQSNTVNLGSIPSAAIERIEVLSGGASAIYGSDAVAGVVNVILRKNFDGNTVSLKAGKPTQGGGNTYDLKWVGGFTGDAWSVTYALQHLERPMILGIERDFMDSWADAPPVSPAVQPGTGLRIRNRALSTTAANNYILPGGAASCDNFRQFDPYAYTSTNTSTGAVTQLGTACAFYESASYQAIRNGDKDSSLYVYGTFDLGNNLEAFASLIAWDQEAESNTGVLSWTSPVFYDTNLKTRVDITRAFSPAEIGGDKGAGMIRIFQEQTIDASGGLRGNWGDYDWTVTLSHSQNESANDRPRILRQAIEDYFLGPKTGETRVGSTVYNNYAMNQERVLNEITPAIWRTLTSNVHTEGTAEVSQASFVLTGDLFELPAGPVGFAAVLETSAQEYELIADQRIVPNADGTTKDIIYNLTGTGGGGERERSAVGVEFAVPLVPTLDAQLAARFDKYDDITSVDDAVTYNAGLTWRPSERFMLRGMWATSFRAPDMHYVFADASGSFSTNRDDYRCRKDGIEYSRCTSSAYNNSMFTVSKGNAGLEEEEGESVSFGMVWDIVDDLSMTLDYYKIELEGMVARLESEWILRKEAECRLGTDRNGNAVDTASINCGYYTSRVIRHTDGPDEGRVKTLLREPINRSFQSTEGIDAKLSYVLKTTDWGRFRTELSWSHVLDLKKAQFAGEPRLSYRDDPTNFDFRSRVRASVNWAYNDWRVTLLARREGSLPNWAETGRIAPFTTYNTSVTYVVDQSLDLQLAVSNLFDKVHPNDATYDSYPFFYRSYSPIGREVSLEARYRF